MDKMPKAIKDFWKDYAGTKRDAERYRWLRENCGYSGSGNHTGAQVIVYYADAGGGKHGIAYTGPRQRVGIMALDDAIDAAMNGANARA